MRTAKRIPRHSLAALLLLACLPASPARAAFPGENGKIAFESNRDGNFEVYAMNADGSGSVNLTRSASSDRQPAWSRDGKNLAFSSNRNGSFHVFVMPADGGSPVDLTPEADTALYPCWSPDGNAIAFQAYDSVADARDLWVVRLDPRSLTRLTTGAGNNRQPAWSPDGRFIAFASDRDGDDEVYLVPADGSSPAIDLTQSPFSQESSPSWSPDGGRIAYVSDSLGAPGIWTMRPDGSDPTPLDGTLPDDNQPAWSPDGTRLAFTSYHDGNVEIYTMNADGTDVQRLTGDGLPYGVSDLKPDWQSLTASEENHPPEANAGADGTVPCAPSEGAPVVLDGSGSLDVDSSPGTNDDIVKFEWLENLGQANETPLGTGQTLAITLAAGVHRITLRVTDGAGATGLDEAVWTISADPPPTLSVRLSPSLLWPPNHRMVPIHADVVASDACGDPGVLLVSIASSEDDGAGHRGNPPTGGDVQGARFGEPDFDFALRAERDGGGSGRVYTVTYAAVDSSGLRTTVEATVVVPHDQSVGRTILTAPRGTRARSVLLPGHGPRR